MAGPKGSRSINSSNHLDLSPYAGRWVALVRGGVAGVGRTADEAQRAAQVSRPKEKPQLRFITVNDWQNFPLLRRLWGFIRRQDIEVLLVGGAVRDGLLGRRLRDLDFVVEGNATALAAAVSRAFNGAFVPLDPERDTARTVLHHAGRRYYVDFARRQGENWEADLKARDFTVNAIALDSAGRYLDPLDGRGDLAAGRLRATNEGAFRDDPLRTLRAVRLAAELDLNVEAHTVAWLRRDAPLLPHVAGERIRDELVRILDASRAAHHMGTLDELGLLEQVLPEVAATRGIDQSPPHQWDVWTHTRLAVNAVEAILGYVKDRPWHGEDLGVPAWVWGDLTKWLSPLHSDLTGHLSRVVSDTRDRRFVLKLAALLHDVGKPHTRSIDEDGRIRFIEHERVSADLAEERLRALRFSGDEIALVGNIVAHHLRPGHLAQSKGPTRRAVYRYFKATGDAGVEVGLLSLADMLAVWGPTLNGRGWSRRLDVVSILLSAYFEQSENVAPSPIVNGHDLMQALNLAPGPEVGRLLEAIREAQAAGEVSSREAALTLAQQLIKET